MTEKRQMSETGKATITASSVALFLVVLKITVGISSGAMVLIASAVDSGLDFLVSVFNHFAVREAEKPSDDRFNYGLGKIEGLASFIEGLVIALSSLFIIFTAVLKINRNEILLQPTAAIVVMVVSIVFTACLVFYLKKVANRTGSLVLKADTVHYQMDLLTNLGILLALVIISKTGFHLIDPLFSIIIAIYIFKTSLSLMKEGMEMLLDKALPPELTEKIEALILEVSPKINSFHQLKTRRSAHINFVDVHLVFNRNISLMEAHKISDRVEQQIQGLEDRTWVVNCHLDPIDDHARDLQKGH